MSVNMWKARYKGDNWKHAGHTAYVRASERPGHVLVQFDDHTHSMAYGWHEFSADDWERIE